MMLAVLSIRREAGRAYTRPLRLLTRLTAGAPAGHVINYFHSSSSQHLVLHDDYSRLIRAAPQSPAVHVKLRAASGTHASDCQRPSDANVRRILVRGVKAPLPPKAKKISKI